MKVCLIGPVPPFRGGIAKYCYSLAKELEKRHELLLLSYRRQYPTLLYGNKSQIDPAADRAEIQAQFRQLSFDIDSANPVSWFETSRSILRFGPDLVILPWWVSYWTPFYLYLMYVLKPRGVKLVLLCINVFEHEDSWLKNLLTRLTLKSAEIMVVHSQEELEELKRLNPKATVVKHLLPLFQYPAPAAPARSAELKLLFFGFVRPYKGLDTLLSALALVKDRPVSLTVAGEFWNDKERYLKQIEELGIGKRVSLIDRYLPDAEMGELFAAADLVVLPYKESRTSGIIATAYGFGKPVLATRVGGFPEIVRDGLTGKLVPPDDPRALADAICWFLDNGAADFSAGIASFAQAELSWQSLVDLIETL